MRGASLKEKSTCRTPAPQSALVVVSKMCWDLTKRRQQHAVAATGMQALEQTFTAYDTETELRRLEQFT